MFDVIGKKRWFFGFSIALVIPSLFFILLTPLTGGRLGLQFSIDYTGGSLWELRFTDASVTPAQVKTTLDEQGLTDSTVVATDNGFLLIRTSVSDIGAVPLDASAGSVGATDGTTGASAGADITAGTAVATQIPTSGKLGEVATALQAAYGSIADQRNLTSVGAIVSSDLINQAVLLILIGSLGILLWITFRFADFKFGIAAIISLIHDVIVVVGTFAVLGTFFGVQIDALFVTAMLTIIGFSVHDTIVVFDRVRENKARHAGESIAAIVNHSVLQTFGRSINTSMTVFITLLALLLFSGSAITYFVLALLIGIVTGTYSSIFNAAPIVVVWQEREDRRRNERLAASRGTRRAAA